MFCMINFITRRRMTGELFYRRVTSENAS